MLAARARKSHSTLSRRRLAPMREGAVVDAATPLPVTSETSAALAWARRNAQTVTALAVYGIALGFALALEFIQDTWLAIAGGRDIAHHGLPWHERLTVA